jgi:hypothetical protein
MSFPTCEICRVFVRPQVIDSVEVLTEFTNVVPGQNEPLEPMLLYRVQGSGAAFEEALIPETPAPWWDRNQTALVHLENIDGNGPTDYEYEVGYWYFGPDPVTGQYGLNYRTEPLDRIDV